MCTAISFNGRYFGRTLDYERSFGEEIVITPRNYPFHFCNKTSLDQHYALIGMGAVVDEYPLYFDATNERGLGMAGLNFVGNAEYFDNIEGKENISPYEFISWILGQCASVKDARKKLNETNLVNIPFNHDIPLASLHWMIADRDETIVVESVAEGLKVYDNPVGVLTNNPPFDIQMFNLNNYMHLSRFSPKNNFSPNVQLEEYSRGLGGMGLPGDASSMSRFVRAAFVKENSLCEDSQMGEMIQFFHILGAVEQQRGCVETADNEYEITRYTSCCDLAESVYYYSTYNNFAITAVNLRNNEVGNTLRRYSLKNDIEVYYEN